MAETWLQTYGGPGGNGVAALSRDAVGDLYVGGTLGGVGYVRKYLPDRTFAWERRMSGAQVRGIAATLGGSVHVTGEFIGQADFGGGPVVSNGYPDVLASNVFVSSYNPDSSFAWARSWGSGQSSAGMAICAMPNGDAVATGYSIGRFLLDPLGPIGRSNTDIFVARFGGLTGVPAYCRFYGGPGINKGLGIARHPFGGFVLVGSMQGDAWSGKSPANAGLSDAFVARLKNNGLVRWVVPGQGTGDDTFYAVAINSGDGSFAVAGRMGAGTFNFGDASLSPAGSFDGVVALLRPSGEVLWVRQIGGGGTDEALGVAYDGARITVAGYYMGTLSPAPAVTLTSRGWRDAFAIGYDTDGGILDAYSWGGAEGDDIAWCAGLDGNERPVVGGYFSGTSDFGAQGKRTAQGATDGFVVAL